MVEQHNVPLLIEAPTHPVRELKVSVTCNPRGVSCPKLGVSVADAKTREESLMLIDANRLRNDPSLSPAVSSGGATVIHVAAAKNYLHVLE